MSLFLTYISDGMCVFIFISCCNWKAIPVSTMSPEQIDRKKKKVLLKNTK